MIQPISPAVAAIVGCAGHCDVMPTREIVFQKIDAPAYHRVDCVCDSAECEAALVARMNDAGYAPMRKPE